MQGAREKLYLLTLLVCICLGSSGLRAQSPFSSSRQAMVFSNAQSGASEKFMSLFAPRTLSANYRLIYPTNAPSVNQMLSVSSVSGSDDSLSWVNGVSGTGSATRVAFWSGTSTLSSNSNLYWDNSSSFLGLGTSSPGQRLDVMNGNIALRNNNNSATVLRLYEPSSSGTDYTEIKAQAQSANISYQMPPSQGVQYSILMNDGAGALYWGTGGVVLTQKSADESVTNSTTLQDDDDFSFSVSANKTYEVHGVIRMSTPAGAGLKVQFTAPSGTTEFVNTFANRSAADDVNYILDPLSSYNICGTSALTPSGDVLLLTGLITTSSTAGTLKLQWTQNVANATSTILYAGSYIKLTLVQ